MPHNQGPFPQPPGNPPGMYQQQQPQGGQTFGEMANPQMDMNGATVGGAQPTSPVTASILSPMVMAVIGAMLLGLLVLIGWIIYYFVGKKTDKEGDEEDGRLKPRRGLGYRGQPSQGEQHNEYDHTSEYGPPQGHQRRSNRGGGGGKTYRFKPPESSGADYDSDDEMEADGRRGLGAPRTIRPLDNESGMKSGKSRKSRRGQGGKRSGGKARTVRDRIEEDYEYDDDAGDRLLRDKGKGGTTQRGDFRRDEYVESYEEEDDDEYDQPPPSRRSRPKRAPKTEQSASGLADDYE